MSLTPRVSATSGRFDYVDLSPQARHALAVRVAQVLEVIGGPDVQPVGLADPLGALGEVVGADPERLWLSHAVLTAALPTDEDMADLLVRARLSGSGAALGPLVQQLADSSRFRDVDIVQRSVTCDVHATAGSDFLSGIQRVVRETAACWDAHHEVNFLGWTNGYAGLRGLRDDEQRRMFGTIATRSSAAVTPVVVPWQSTHLWVEVVTDLERSARLLAMAKFSPNQIGVLGFDSIPITSAATVAPGMTSHFARSMAAVRQADRVAMISRSAAEEFRSVSRMGAGRRDSGPHVAAIPLAVSAPPTAPRDLAEARMGLTVGDLPMVLVVGSHEPRKNHLSILHAAEVLWREGLRFSVVLVGAGAWNAAEFDRSVGELVGAGRPIQSLRGLPDRLVWAAYRLAHVTVFPSLNEGFGLPVAESLAVGTPVITSAFGSMRDLLAPRGEPEGGLLVDPRDDASLTNALRMTLSDRVLHHRLSVEAAQCTGRTWDEYAEELWTYLVDGVEPVG